MTTTGERFFRPIAPPPTPRTSERAAIEDRLPAFDGGPADARAKLAAAVVAVIGVGSVGRVAAEHLARVGVGTLELIDRAAIKPQSLLTHASTRPDDVGHPKAASAGSLCKSVRPDSRILVFDSAIENLPPAALVDTDIVLLASDNLAAEVCAGQLCAWLRVPLVHAAVQGEMMVTQIRTFASRADDEAACPRCAFGSAEEAILRAGQHFPCDGGSRGAGVAPTPPTMSTSALCGLAGSMAATLAIRHLLNLGEPLRDAIHEWCGYTLETWSGPIRRRGDCPTDHRAWEVIRIGRPIGAMSLREVAGACEMPWSPALMIEVDAFLTDERQAAGFVADDGSLPRVFARRQAALSGLQAVADQPLAEITPASPRWVKVADDSRTCLVVEAVAR